MTLAWPAPPPGSEARARGGVDSQTVIEICESDMPLAAITADPSAVLALITGVEGPSYRPPGAAMVLRRDGTRIGSLSSGCLDRDLALHAAAALRDLAPRRLRYGRGSPFLDITLPCGGGLDILLIPAPAQAELRAARDRLAARQPAQLYLTPEGRMGAAPVPGGLTLNLRPQTRFVIFGTGPEASCFARLTAQAGFPTELFSPDEETLAECGFGQHLAGAQWPAGLALDPQSAVTLFFHDHDREPALLAHALGSPAFFVGAQGSLRAHQARLAALQARGLPAGALARLAAPFGLIPSARDPRTLAVSVLAHVLQMAMPRKDPA